MRYFAPGNPDLAHSVRALASNHHAVQLASHRPAALEAFLTQPENYYDYDA